jgi:hypothetical protein
VHAFITFLYEDGYRLAAEFEHVHSGEKAKGSVLGEDLCMIGATEPTNIIWENRHYTDLDTKINSCCVTFAIILMLSFSLVIIWVLKMQEFAITAAYPPVNCN